MLTGHAWLISFLCLVFHFVKSTTSKIGRYTPSRDRSHITLSDSTNSGKFSIISVHRRGDDPAIGPDATLAARLRRDVVLVPIFLPHVERRELRQDRKPRRSPMPAPAKISACMECRSSFLPFGAGPRPAPPEGSHSGRSDLPKVYHTKCLRSPSAYGTDVAAILALDGNGERLMPLAMGAMLPICARELLHRNRCRIVSRGTPPEAGLER